MHLELNSNLFEKTWNEIGEKLKICSAYGILKTKLKRHRSKKTSFMSLYLGMG
jgi:hypothetical protein